MTQAIQIGVPIAVMLFVIGFVLESRARRRRAAELSAQPAATPPSLYPKINALACICSGNCVAVCPEQDVLAMIGGRPRLVTPSACVGHADCLRSCPTHAIELVLGSPDRGVEVPTTSGTFETSVRGLYVAGEVTGIGLIHNAVAQGRQAAKFALDGVRGGEFDLDVVIVGAGPAGLGAAMEARHRGVRYRVYEKATVGGAIRSYPRQKIVMSAPMEFPGIGKYKLSARRTSKEALVDMFEGIVRDTELHIVENAEVKTIRAGQGFTVTALTETVTAARVIVAIGRRGAPRRLVVPGAELPHVVFELQDPSGYANQPIVVVGGGDSAVEMALALARGRANVTLVHRGPDFGRTKPDNRRALEAARAAGELVVMTNANLRAVTPTTVQVDDAVVAATSVVCCLGADLPTEWLRGVGIQLRVMRGEPLVRA